METAIENILSTMKKEQMIAYVKEHSEAFEELIKLSLTDRQPYAWRAAWLLWSCMEDNDPRVRKYMQRIIDILPTKNDGHTRDLMKVLLFLELDEEYDGVLFDLAVSIWERIDKKPATRYNAFKMIVKIAKKYPELAQETSFLVQDEYMDSLSSGVKHSVTKMLKEIS